ncbi:unnamed protein product [Trifolium pratense]|uniref:Uncharacterized protein n=1 Tax=Trifolium pratense TaxID=57577 RepID=A0ACB0M5Z6_TRIPR|nr:unnamed protein product [Trifolium pratense]
MEKTTKWRKEENNNGGNKENNNNNNNMWNPYAKLQTQKVKVPKFPLDSKSENANRKCRQSRLRLVNSFGHYLHWLLSIKSRLR